MLEPDEDDYSLRKEPEPVNLEWDAMMLRPDKPLSNRHREVARLFAHGKTNKFIARRLGYHPQRISQLLKEPKIVNEIARVRDKLFEVDMETRLKEISGDAMDVMEAILMDPTEPAHKKESAARWILEKTTGKPTQQVEHRGEVSVGVFLDRLDQVANQKTATGASSPIDVTPSQSQDPKPELSAKTSEKGEQGAEERDDNTPERVLDDEFSQWLDKNLA